MPLSFTQKHFGTIREIITEVHVSVPIFEKPINKNDKRIHKMRALWDTGATNSVITVQTATALGLKPTSIVPVRHADGISYKNAYRVNIYLPNSLAFINVAVTECPDTVGNFGVIIGMDIISESDFAFTNTESKSVFSFRHPSTETIDYVAHDRGIPFEPYKAPKQPGRNAPCSCGSGKKFKHCCGKKS